MVIRFLLIVALLSFAVAVSAQPEPSASAVRVVLAGGSTVTNNSAWRLGFKEGATDRVPLVDPFNRGLELSELPGPRALEPFSARQPNGDVDTTHVNAAGTRVLARLVIRELREVVPAPGTLLTLE